MSVQDMKFDALTYLFQNYKNDGGGKRYDLTDIITKHNLNHNEGGRYLVAEGLLRDHSYGSRFLGEIAIKGITLIDPIYFNNLCHSVLYDLDSGEEWVGVRDALDFKPEHNVRARDVAQILEFDGLVELLYQDDIYVKLTVKGRDFCEQNRTYFL